MPTFLIGELIMLKRNRTEGVTLFSPQSEAEGLESRIKANEESLNLITERLTELHASVDVHSANLAECTLALSKVQEDLADLSNDPHSYGDPADCFMRRGHLMSQISNLDEEASSLSQKLEGIKTKIANLKRQMAHLEERKEELMSEQSSRNTTPGTVPADDPPAAASTVTPGH